MAGFLEIIDQLRDRGAVEISLHNKISVKFAGPKQIEAPIEKPEPPTIIERPQDLDALLFMETTNL